MPPDSVDLDGHRSGTEQQATDQRRQLEAVRQDQGRLEERQATFDAFMSAGPARNWPEAAARAQYVIQLLMDSYGVRDPRQRELVARVFSDFATLTGDTPKGPEAQ
ncbi:hypothetical protein [Dongia rigui]|uniref:Uncharacterized protein n=1 Tax=Dongia rigui TaxID=940149 RepID=A0ABU5DZ31_9PROT|nr:hypothetical protein [Dongia rigui]MDY0872180.1 hypothetical protein [Dongia rigui]